jgi:hypothetical protein
MEIHVDLSYHNIFEIAYLMRIKFVYCPTFIYTKFIFRNAHEWSWSFQNLEEHIEDFSDEEADHFFKKILPGTVHWRIILKEMSYIVTSVADPWHFSTDPRIHASH